MLSTKLFRFPSRSGRKVNKHDKNSEKENIDYETESELFDPSTSTGSKAFILDSDPPDNDTSESNRPSTKVALTITESPSNSQKRVQWGSIEFLTHNIILGRNPSVTSGPPLEIGWKLLDKKKLDIDLYESLLRRRTKLDLILPRLEREERLREEGYSRGEIREVVAEVVACQEQRKRNAPRGRLRQMFWSLRHG